MYSEDNEDELSVNATAKAKNLQFNSKLNLTYCESLFLNKTLEFENNHPGEFCPVTFDPLLCWPPALHNTTIIVKCFAELNTVKYDYTQNATRFCLANQTWQKANYDNCVTLSSTADDDNETQSTIYLVGYTLSFITLAIAIGIFTYFKELRCLRNRIHMNLMWSYTLQCFMWIVIIIFGSGITPVTCIISTTLMNYFHITTFFWMFVEGLYLYILVVETLTRENFKLRVYVFIGWGLPMLFITLWIILKTVLPWEETEKLPGSNNCAWFDFQTIDWIFIGPSIILLVVNVIFLIAIMWILITKLRSANTVETQQYHKAAKALLVLTPLLGITFVITFQGPNPANDYHFLFECTRSVLLSTQGFTVALFYCFLNTEVQNTVRHHFETWKTRRSLGPSRLRSGSRSKDWSPRSRTESIRLYSHPTTYQKRESCTSEVTTTTLVTVNGGGATNKPANNARSPFLQPPRPSYGGDV